MSKLAATASSFAKFAEVGATVAGRIVKVEDRQQREFITGVAYESRPLLFWPEGKGRPTTQDTGRPLWETLVTLQQVPGDEESNIIVVVNGSRLTKATIKAFQEAGRNDITEGDDMRVTFTGKEGSFNAKVYEVKYSANDGE